MKIRRIVLAFPNIHSAEGYPLDRYDIADVIEAEANNVLSEANSDHLEEPTDECYEALRQKVIKDATASLMDRNGNPIIGAAYTDPIGIKWEIVEEEDPESEC